MATGDAVSGPPAGPLAGLLVADCSTVLAGPYCTMLLADLGATVIKVEPPDGDGTRAWGPPWVGAGLLADGDPGVAAYYLAVNRNKRSLRLDLKQEAGRAVLRRLVARADVLVENFRVGGFAELGFDDDALAGLNPRLVHLAISGYGPTGPEAAKPGYDFVIQAVSGLMSITGAADRAGRATDASPAAGRGQRIDVSILEATLAVLVNQAQNAFATGTAPTRRGNAHPNIVPYEAFATADGEIAVAVGSERQWTRFCVALDLAPLATDGRFATNAARVASRAELRPILAARLAGEPTHVWLDRLEAAEVPCGPINDLLTALSTDQVRARDMVVEVDHPRLGRLRQLGIPFKLAATPASIRTAPPLLGEHATEILAELGYDVTAIDRLRSDGVI